MNNPLPILFFTFLLLLNTTNSRAEEDGELLPGASRTEEYLPIIKHLKVAIVANHTSQINKTHLVDSLLKRGVNIIKIFSPEHGFRGTGDAGKKINNSKDKLTGIPIVSLYGDRRKPSAKDMQNIDVLLFDIQDVGVRFYTYISTMHYVMDACAKNNIPLIILDRPNPNGHYIDGPVLEDEYTSFVGMHPVPLVHGMTIAEYAKMINGEGWLSEGIKCKISYVPCLNYDHSTKVRLNTPPSPNLRSMKAIYAYPTLGLFEGTIISVGRGTEKPFTMFGHPDWPCDTFTFTPKSIIGMSTNPKHIDKKCFGKDISQTNIDSLYKQGVHIEWLLNAYAKLGQDPNFFNNFFNLLAGNNKLQEQIKQQKSAEEIRESWQKGLVHFNKIRKQYLLYEDF
ncbi:MAG: exo-beta-N-acetylmuramidase NamZ domain-containing protein [Bacteroidota bacterium]